MGLNFFHSSCGCVRSAPVPVSAPASPYGNPDPKRFEILEVFGVGRGSLYDVNNHHRPGLWVLAARLGRGATDPEHDSPFAFKLPLVGVEFERVEEGCLWAHGFVDAYDGEEFHVPRPGYDPFKKRGASTCRYKACGEKHPIVPEGCYVPKFDAALYEAVKGRLVDIRMLVLAEKKS
jgi:hypothetical protein